MNDKIKIVRNFKNSQKDASLCIFSGVEPIVSIQINTFNYMLIVPRKFDLMLIVM